MPLVETMFCGEGLVEKNDEMTQEEPMDLTRI